MPTRFGTASTPRRRADAGACVALAVYHASPDVRQHVAELARLRRFRVTCIPQRQVPARRPARVADAVLWELVPGKRPNRRRLAALARGVPLVSYSVSYSIDADRYLAELSHTAGFTTHLKAPLRPVEIDCQLALAQPTELSARLRMCRAPLGRHLARHDVLADVFRRVNASVEPARVAEVLAADVSRWLPVASWAVLVPDERHALRILASRGLASGLEPAALAFGGWTFRRGKESASANLACDRRTPVGPAVAAVAFPLVSRGRTVGVLVGLDAQPAERVPTMGPELVATLGMVVEPASIALDNALRLQRATSLSLTDDLTRLYNSRFLSVVLRRETKRTSRTGNPLSMLFVDLDGFKTINDRHGHLCGSRALVEAARVIRGSARETDFVARFGGDEFAVVLPDTGGRGAEAVGNRVRDRIAAHVFLAGEGCGSRLTASVGVATLPDAATSADGLLQAADEAMSHVKAQGKNGILVAT